MKAGLLPGEFFLPAGTDMQKWSVVACDQFTSEPDYWRRTEAFVGNQPSTLHAILPEIYLDQEDTEKRIEKLNTVMKTYIKQGLFIKHTGYVYIERLLNRGIVRHGLLGVIDLEDYSFASHSDSLIRSTEGTVLERIPPRVAIRKDAPLEFPHVMLLFDDPDNTVFSSIAGVKDECELLYDFELMENGGRITGRLLDRDVENKIITDFSTLSSKSPMLFAVGDGNHSLAAAKTCYESLKATMPEDEYLSHPARYALVEAVNLHDPALEFEPIHRVVFGVDADHLLSSLKSFYRSADPGDTSHIFHFITAEREGETMVENTGFSLPVAALQHFLDHYIKEHGGKVDYIHGDETVETLASKPGNIGFLLPSIPKNNFFAAVIRDGAFPRKTFSCGNAEDKRYYLECREII